MLRQKVVSKLTDLRKNQSGMASIVIAIVFCSVTALIILGFSSLVRREQRQALDQQLYSRARTAAESKLNEVIAKYRNDPNSVATTPAGSCADTTSIINSTTGSEDVQITCVRIDKTPGGLEYSAIKTNEPAVIWLRPNNHIDRIVISWQNGSFMGSDCLLSEYTQLPGSLEPNDIGMIRFDLTIIGPDGEPFTKRDLTDNLMGGVLYPKQGGTGTRPYVTDVTSGQPVIFGSCGDVPADVSEPHKAYAVIDNLPLSGAATPNVYMVRLQGIYKNSEVKINGLTSVGDQVIFSNEQIVVEVTARATDVVTRIRGRIPAYAPPQAIIPTAAVHVTGDELCKTLQTEPNGTAFSNC